MAAKMGYVMSGEEARPIVNKFKAIKPPEKGYDPKTFLFHNHIADDNK